MAIFASLKFYISGEDQRPPTKFGSLVEFLGLHFRVKARWDRANQIGAINDEPMRG